MDRKPVLLEAKPHAPMHYTVLHLQLKIMQKGAFIHIRSGFSGTHKCLMEPKDQTKVGMA